MNNNPIISVITPTYNSERYIERCIQSLLSQGFTNFEHIIIDGDSGDKTLDIVKKYSSSYNLKYISEKDNGMYDAIAKGFKMASGEIICWLNSDDMYIHSTLQTVFDVFQNNQDINWITGIPSNLTSDGVMYSLDNFSIPLYSSKWISKGKHHGKGAGFIQQESTFFKKCTVQDLDLEVFSRYKYAGDFFLWKHISKKYTLHTVNTILSSFRSHGNQLSSNIEAYYREISKYCNLTNVSWWLLNKVFHVNKLYYFINRKNLININIVKKTKKKNTEKIKDTLRWIKLFIFKKQKE